MMSEIVNVEQGTLEWHQLRASLITGSKVGRILGRGKSMLKEMAKTMGGDFSSYQNDAMKWGTDHESVARNFIEYEIGIDFSDQRFRRRLPYGYSPDGVSPCSKYLLEVKCPYRLRNTPSERLDFKSVYSQKNYLHQVQLGMEICNSELCYFIQWAPSGYLIEEVPRDEQWMVRNSGAIDAFLLELNGDLE
jgi:putative phage-type endonuclease